MLIVWHVLNSERVRSINDAPLLVGGFQFHMYVCMSVCVLHSCKRRSHITYLRGESEEVSKCDSWRVLANWVLEVNTLPFRANTSGPFKSLVGSFGEATG